MRRRANDFLLVSLICFLATATSILEPTLAQQPALAPTNAKATSSQADGLFSNLRTIAETSEYQDTARYEDVENYLRSLANNWDAAELESLGQTVEGREIWALIVEPNVTPKKQDTPSLEPLTILLLGGIHSGECDGKEALMALARDYATEDKPRKSRLIFVPNYNADGNERRGPLHRPRQEGPAAGMGIRENAQGLDLNREFVKLESPEARSLTRALNEYDVDVLIDTHTTNGSLHGYQLTFDIPHNPATDSRITRFLREAVIPNVSYQAKKEYGFDTFYYGNFNREHNRWNTYGFEPRYSTEIMGLRNRIGILSESYSYASYRTRIQASYTFVHLCIQNIEEESAYLQELFATLDQSVGPELDLALGGTLQRTMADVPVKGFIDSAGSPPKPPYGAQALAKNEPKEYRVEVWNRYEPTHVVQLPAAYIVPAQHAWAVNRLLMHGIEVNRLVAPAEQTTTGYFVTSTKNSSRFQDHRMLSLDVKAQAPQTTTLTAGDFVILTNQPLGKLAGYLLEPQSSDSLATWNFFDPEITADEMYPVTRLASIDGLQLESLWKANPDTDPLKVEQLTLEHIAKPGQVIAYEGPRSTMPTWFGDTNQYLKQASGRLQLIDAKTGSREPVQLLADFEAALKSLGAIDSATAARLAKLSAFDETFQHALVKHQNDLIYYDASDQVIRQLTHTPGLDERLAELSPTGDYVAFVRDNDLWMVNCSSTELTRLTNTGSTEHLNGVLDWVYQEELYGRGNFKGFWWSPDGNSLAMLELDQTPVPSYQVSDSISFSQSLEATRYPKAGQPLPTAEVWIIDVKSQGKRKLNLNAAFKPDDRLVGRVTWSPSNELWLQVFNRVQNQQTLLKVNRDSGQHAAVLTEVSPGWIEIRDVPRFLNDGNFLWLSDLPEGRTHLFLVQSESGAMSQLTSGDWDIDAIEAVLPDKNLAYVSGNIDSPIERHLIQVNLSDRSVRKVTAAPGSHRVRISQTGDYFIDSFSSLVTPPQVTLRTIGGEQVRVLDAPPADRHTTLDIAPPKTFEIEARDGQPLQAMLMLPRQYDAEHAGKLPMVVHVYGGPQAPTIRDAWEPRYIWWHQMLCQNGFAVMLVDNRASRGNGVKDTWKIRGDLGQVELRDLEDAVKWAHKQAWCDPNRVGLWGWSYGGYFTAYAMTHSKLFAAGISGAPVTDWRNYDAIYTERYMDLPQSNPEGYRTSSVVEAANNLSGDLLLIHGERDDNVHISNTLQLAYALQLAGKQFELMVYPKNRHGIVQPDQKYHLRRLMTDFFMRKLKKEQ